MRTLVRLLIWREWLALMKAVPFCALEFPEIVELDVVIARTTKEIE